MPTDLHTSTKSALGQLSLLGLRGVGPKSALAAGRATTTLAEVLDGDPAPLGLKRKVEHDELMTSLDAACRAAALWASQGVTAVSYFEPAYPELFRKLSDAPAVVWTRGSLPPAGQYVACIGTREPSRFGEVAAARISSHLAEAGWSVVSGLALGVDAICHQAALDAGGHTVAILANGLDSVYPAKNRQLAEAILDRGGAWLSEQPFGVPALPRLLVQRDRLQSGMSAGTVVMQTDVVGGSMHTVRFTLTQGRRLFCATPGPPHDAEPKSRGVIALTTRTGSDLSSLLRAEGDYSRLLRDTFATRPPAMSIANRDDYPVLLASLRDCLVGLRRTDGPVTPGGERFQPGLFR